MFVEKCFYFSPKRWLVQYTRTTLAYRSDRSIDSALDFIFSTSHCKLASALFSFHNCTSENMAGIAGFEPANAGVKAQCLYRLAISQYQLTVGSVLLLDDRALRPRWLFSMPCYYLWQGNRESNSNLLFWRQSRYHYTIPL